MKMNRREAIERFGRAVHATSYNLPNYEYPDFRRQTGLEGATATWRQGSLASPLITFKEILGPSKIIGATNSKWGEFIDNIFAGQDKVSDTDIADAIKGYAVAAYDRARQALPEAQAPQSVLQKLQQMLPSTSLKLPTGEELFNPLRVKVEYLSDEIEFPDIMLDIGDTIYQLSDYDIRNKGTRIVEYPVTSIRLSKATKTFPQNDAKCTCEMDHIEQGAVYDVHYTVRKSETAMPIHFELTNGGQFKGLTTGDCFYPSGYFFLKRTEAEDLEGKIWKDMEEQLNRFRERNNTQKPV